MYEILCLISSKIEEKNLSELIAKIEEIFKNFEIEPIYRNNLGLKKLAYPISHETKGYYFVIGFESRPELLKKIEEKLKNIPEILRYLITKTKGFKITEEKKEKVDLEKLDKKIEKILTDENKLIK